MRTTFLNISLLGLFLIFGPVFVTNSFSQEKKSVKLTGAQVEKARGENPNIKFHIPDNDDNPAPKPEKERGAYCSIDFVNWTGYYIYVYVDGNYKGTLDPWDEGNVTIYAGYKTVYCITTGGTWEWSDAGNCDYYFTYDLYTP